MKALVFAAALAVITTATMAQQVTLFDRFPLGAKFTLTKVCPSNWHEGVKELCWLERPKNYSGERSGPVQFPNKTTLPSWAEFAPVELLVRGDLLARVQLHIYPQDQLTVIKSIAARFGEPGQLSLSDPSAKWAIWERPDITIHFSCGTGKWCWLYFTSAEESARNARIRADLKQRDAARPKMP